MLTLDVNGTLGRMNHLCHTFWQREYILLFFSMKTNKTVTDPALYLIEDLWLWRLILILSLPSPCPGYAPAQIKMSLTAKELKKLWYMLVNYSFEVLLSTFKIKLLTHLLSIQLIKESIDLFWDTVLHIFYSIFMFGSIGALWGVNICNTHLQMMRLKRNIMVPWLATFHINGS